MQHNCLLNDRLIEKNENKITFDAAGDYDNEAATVSMTKGMFYCLLLFLLLLLQCDAGDYDNRVAAVSVTKGC